MAIMMLWMLLSCLVDKTLYDELSASMDADSDGHPAAVDCNDQDATIFPGAPELCDSLDNDCDQEVDEDPADGSVWYLDGDGDGYGQTETSVTSCSAPEGRVPLGEDCDDSDATIYPGAEESWYDGVDSDCAQDSDYDADQDGQDALEWAGEDCDDADPQIFLGAEESWVDPGIDNDCDGDSTDPVTYDLALLDPVIGLDAGDNLGARMLVLPPEWTDDDAVVLVSAPGALGGQGEVYGFGASALDQSSDLESIGWLLSGAWDDHSLGAELAWAGSAGSPVVVLTAPGADQGRTYLFHSSWDPHGPGDADAWLEGEHIPDLGRSMASGHDHDGDGRADLVLSRGHPDHGGESILIFLDADRLWGELDPGDADIVLDITTSFELRTSLQALGDVNEDGMDDLGVGIGCEDGTLPGGAVLTQARESGNYGLLEESSVHFFGEQVRFGVPVDTDGDGTLELLAGPDQLYRLALPLLSGTVDWLDAEASASLPDSAARISGIHTEAPALGGISRVGVRSTQVSDERGAVYLGPSEWSDSQQLGSHGLFLVGEDLSDNLGASMAFIESPTTGTVHLLVGAPGSDRAADDAGALYRLSLPE